MKKIFIFVVLLSLLAGSLLVMPASAANPQDIILIIDTSGSMQGQPMEDAKRAAISFCESILAQNHLARIAVLDFDSQSRILTSFTNDAQTIRNVINPLRAGGGTNVEAAFRQAKYLFLNDARVGARRTIVFLSDGVPTSGSTTNNPNRYDSSVYGQYNEHANFVYQFVTSRNPEGDNMSVLTGPGMPTFVYDSIWTVFFGTSPDGSADDRLGRRLMRDIQTDGYFDASLGWDIDWTLDAISQSIRADSPFIRGHQGRFRQESYARFAGNWIHVDLPWQSGFFANEPRFFNRDLAIASLLITASTDHENSGERVMDSLGFSNIQDFRLDSRELANHRIRDIGYSMGHQVIEIGGELRNLFILTIVDSGGLSEWISNFSLYATSSHFHAGFELAANIINDDFGAYTAAHANAAYGNIFLVTGYSRGAAIANILGANRLEQNPDSINNTYVYTFGSPNTFFEIASHMTISPFRGVQEGIPATRTVAAARNIHNVVNYQDIVAHLAPNGTKPGNIWAYSGPSSAMYQTFFERILNMPDAFDYSPGEIFTGVRGNHSYEFYLASLMTEDPEVFRSDASGGGFLIHFNGPIDATVFADGEVVARFERNRVDHIVLSPSVLTAVDGDSKFVLVPIGPEYEIRLSAFGRGSMTYGVLPLDNTPGQNTIFENAHLEESEHFISFIRRGEIPLLQILDGNSIIGSVNPDGSRNFYIIDDSEAGTDAPMQVERPRLFAPSPRAVARVTDADTAVAEIDVAVRVLTPEQRTSGDALSSVALHIEQVERRGTTQQLPRGGRLDAAALQICISEAQGIRDRTEAVLDDEGVLLQRLLRTNLNFETDEQRRVALEFPDDVANIAFDNITVEAPFASATVSRAHIASGNSLQFSRIERVPEDYDAVGVAFGERMTIVLDQERTFVSFMLDFWVLLLIDLLLITWIVLRLSGKRLRVWVLPTFVCLAIAVNIFTLWLSFDPDDHAEFYDGVIEVSMTEGMHAMLSLPVDDIRGNPENLILFNEDGEAQFTKFNPTTGAVDARIRSGGTFTLREHTVRFADISDKSVLMLEAIQTIASRGIMRGVTENEFGPDDLITRSQFVTTIVMAFDLLDLDAQTTFTDLEPASWYYHAIATAENEGLVQAFEDGTFRGELHMRNDELIVVSANALVRQMGYIFPTDVEPILARYIDRPEIEGWAEGGVALCTQSNIVIFREDGLFGPGNVMTRGEAAIILFRLFNRVW